MILFLSVNSVQTLNKVLDYNSSQRREAFKQTVCRFPFHWVEYTH